MGHPAKLSSRLAQDAQNIIETRTSLFGSVEATWQVPAAACSELLTGFKQAPGSHSRTEVGLEQELALAEPIRARNYHRLLAGPCRIAATNRSAVPKLERVSTCSPDFRSQIRISDANNFWLAALPAECDESRLHPNASSRHRRDNNPK